MAQGVRKTKIVCTIGPASQKPEVLRQLMRGGMNVARLNFSHGDHAEQQAKVDIIKQIREEENLPVALLLDTKGPEIRTNDFVGGRVTLKEGNEIYIRNAEVLGSDKEFSVTYKGMHEDLVIGDSVLIDDGLVELEVVAIEGKDLRCVVRNSGDVANHKSINLPDVDTHLPAMTEQDMRDIQFAVDNDMDFIAASFVRRADDVIAIRRLLEKIGGEGIHIISKIENRQGVRNFDEILEVSDAIMVARGDLGVEIPAYEVPIVQKMMITKCYEIGKPCITATQMLDSMIRNPRPTRAEASDVANAILDGTSAIMLSGETANGRYPLEAVKMMSEIAHYTEENQNYWEKFLNTRFDLRSSVTSAVSHASCSATMDLNAKAIVAVTYSGRTARQLASFRPACPIIATTVSARAQRQLNLAWGVIPFQVDEMRSTDELFATGLKVAADSGLVRNGDLVVITGGTPVGMSGTTNTMKVANVGQLLCHGFGVANSDNKIVTGEATVISDAKQVKMPTRIEGILVAEDTDDDMIPLMRQAQAVVVESTDHDCHAITVGKTLDIPIIYACENATKIIKQGQLITVDAASGFIS